MQYLYFDIECCDGNHICSFGYVIVDENFVVQEKKDLVINPEKPFKLGRDGFDPRIHLAYQEETFLKQKNFKHFYPIIKNLLTENNTIILGHGIASDIKYLKNACKRYALPEIDLKVYDTQNFYYQLNKKYPRRSLKNIVKDLDIDINYLQEHKSCDDAEISMLVVKEICRRLDISIDELLVLCESSIKDGTNNPISPKDKKKRFIKDLKAIALRYPQRGDWQSICLSDTIFADDFEKQIQLIKKIFKKKYNYRNQVSRCDYFVMGDGSGVHDKSCEYNINECGKQIKKITLEQLEQMLGVDIDVDICENKSTKNTNKNQQPSEMQSALLESLAKKGMTYEQYINSFQQEN